MKTYYVEESPFSHFLLADTRVAWVWLIARVWLGWQWLEAGYEKFTNPAWVGPQAGAALNGFMQGALHKTAEYCTNPAACHPDVQGWYASFITSFVLPHVTIWSYAVTYGEMAIGIALIVGFLVGISAFFGGFMNLNFMLAGSVSVNPVWYTIAIALMLAWRVAGHWGLDYYVLPILHRSIRPVRKMS